ncbi:DUF3320 domain-containing protein [Methylobacterium sp. E-045]|uniref:DUF3320 domain-containing protein n=1 Tax=Methylobacterium sp. E-045 TaxID=2836575 RepID=UPI001FB924EA|nr:DUF3320 domain-containing protein [Methylobacterium sp. E-045]MCJ2128316.1 DUF3320 domain-containing protein [Methylobacterium sp. E-045]
MDDTLEVSEGARTRCGLACTIADHASVASWLNGIPLIRDITLSHGGEADLSDVALRISAIPPLFRPLTLPIQRIAAGGLQRIDAPDLRIDGAFLAGLRESRLCTVKLTLTAPTEETDPAGEIAREEFDLRLLPPSHWGGADAAPELLAAFVRPDDPAVDGILRSAAAILERARRSTAFDGYRSGKRARAWEMAEAIHAAMAALRISAILPPPSFERSGQKVREPGAIVERRLATCLDLTLLWAACCEQAGLNPLLILTRDHALLGLWLVDETLPERVGDDAQALRKRRDLQELILVETTVLTADPPGPFTDAVAAGARRIEADAEAPLEMVLDLRRARLSGIAPLDTGEPGTEAVAPEIAAPLAQALGAPPSFVEDLPPARIDPPRREPRDRLEAWKLRLLDLTLRNKLLNFKPGKGSLTLDCPEPGAFEDALAAGRAFRLVARPAPEAPVGAADRDRGEIAADVGAEELEARLTDLFRLARGSFEEGGANVLFLAFGFLTWTRGNGMPPARAPLLLVPAALTRASVRAGFRLVRHDEEARLNPTLLEMLRQDFDLDMPDVAEGLPGGESGIDVEGIWRIVRTHIRDLKGFEVTTEVVLSAFSFTKFLMWKDLSERTDLLKRSPVVRHLLDTPKQAYGDGTGFPVPERLDAEHPPSGIFTPLLADSSQVSAILAAASGKDFVLFGPPGTGKSQTIANMIAQCLALGRTVLFVSQKSAALEVVRRRLDAVGLGACCLEVHAAKAQKTHVIAQLREAWTARGGESVPWEDAAADLQRRRAALNGVVESLHATRANGLSAHSAMGRVIADRQAGRDGLSLVWPKDAASAPGHRESLRALCDELAALRPIVGDIADHPLRGIGVIAWSPLWRAEMEQAVPELARTLPDFAASGRRLAGAMGLEPLGRTYDGLRALSSLAAALFRPEARMGLRFLGPGGAALRQAVEARRARQDELARLNARLRVPYAPSVFGSDLGRLLAEWREAKASNIFLRGRRLGRVRGLLAPFAQRTAPEEVGPDLVTLAEIKALQAAQPALAEILASAAAELRHPWSDPAAPAELFTAPMAWATRLAPVITAMAPLVGGPAIVRARLAEFLDGEDGRLEPGGNLALAKEDFTTHRIAAVRAIETLGRLVGRAKPDRPVETDGDWVAGTLAVADRWKRSLPKAQAWASWQVAAGEATKAGLGPLVAAIEAGAVRDDAILTTFEGAYARWWIDHAVTDDIRLRDFMGQRHEEAVRGFGEADSRLSGLAGAAVRARIGGGVPLAGAFGTDPEWGTLAREITKRARHMPLRQLFARMPNALTRLTPCLMMSPLSIAQYWPAEAKPFDIVIFDEASQIAPWDAIGAIARGRQVVIVGDPEQLPPTNVGDRGVDEIPDGLDVADQESILDECLAANLPQRRLAWHYRSRHESLIAFSNRHYYRGGLITFPSPVTEDRAVRLHYVSDGLYERGGARVNRPEARALVAEVVARLAAPAFAAEERSLGIVTFNGEQQRLIENLLDAERRGRPELERFFDGRTWKEPVFVKNLETVQGDERDAILFSVAAGPDAAGRITGQISSLNREGGHRRLNVAITRARRELVVFASMRADQVDLGRGSARGVRDFKHFLDFAEHGARVLETAAAPTGGDIESPFEGAVMAALAARGWRLIPQVGVSAFRIDLGIVHPDAPGRYLAGVECDGATYHRAATARDRDRLREWVLTDLGWRIHRVWSTDWWNDPQGALDRLDRALRADLDADRAKPEPAVIAPATPDIPPAEPPGLYEPADLSGFSPDAARFHDAGYEARLAAMAADVVTREGPVFADILAERLLRAHGFSRITARLRQRALGAVDPRCHHTSEGDRIVLWPEAAPAGPVRFRPAGGEARAPGDIPLQELAGLARDLDPAPGIEARMAAHLGLGRMSETVRARFAEAASLAREGEAPVPVSVG